MAIIYGPTAPLINGPNGIMGRQEDERLIRNDLLSLLLTSPGERVMHSSFGTGIKKFVFDGMTDAAIEDLRQNIANAVAIFEPRVLLSDVRITYTDQNRNILNIALLGQFRTKFMRGDNTTDFLVEVNVPIGGVSNG